MTGRGATDSLAVLRQSNFVPLTEMIILPNKDVTTSQQILEPPLRVNGGSTGMSMPQGPKDVRSLFEGPTRSPLTRVALKTDLCGLIIIIITVKAL
jgi:hypothetical protein